MVQRLWSKFAPGCIQCGTNERKHYGRDMCRRCYRKWYRKTPSGIAERKRYWAKYQHTETFKDKNHNQKLRKEFGWTFEMKQSLLESQGGKCAICREKPHETLRKWHLDHDHVTGKIRGILCASCNIGIGHFKDNAILLRLAAEYLEWFSKISQKI